MEYTLIEKTKTDAKVRLVLNDKEWQKELDKAAAKTKQKFDMKGFSKGKAPRKLIEKTNGEDTFYQEAANALIQDNFVKIIKELKIEAFGYPFVEVNAVSQDVFDIMLNIALEPSVEIGKYKGLKIKVPEEKATDKEVAEVLSQSQKRLARIETTKNKSKLGDTLNIDFAGFDGKVQFQGGTATNFDLEIGSGTFIPGFEEQLVGKKVGDEVDVNVTFPADYHSEALAGKPVLFKCKVNEVKTKILPELNDEFAKDTSEFETLEALKADIKTKIEAQKKHVNMQQQQGKLLESIIESSKFNISKQVIEEEMHYAMEDFQRMLAQKGLSIQSYLSYMKKTMEEVRQMKTEEATQMIKMRLVLQEIVRKEKIEVTEEDLIDSVIRSLPDEKLTKDAAKKYIGKLPEERLHHIKNEMLVRKAFEFITKN